MIRHVLSLRHERKQKDPSYWAEAGYEGTTRAVLSLCGLPVFRFKVLGSIEDIYLGRTYPEVHRGVEELVQKRLIPPLESSSRVLEVGCNAGMFLKSLHDKFDCEIHGVDISESAIRIAEHKVLAGIGRQHLYCEDVLNTPLLDGFDSGYFSHVFSISHLVHLHPGERKKHYIEQLKRISRSLIVFERIPSKEYLSSGNRFLEDLATEYGLKCHKTLKKPSRGSPKHIGLYYYAEENGTI